MARPGLEASDFSHQSNTSVTSKSRAFITSSYCNQKTTLSRPPAQIPCFILNHYTRPVFHPELRRPLQRAKETRAGRPIAAQPVKSMFAWVLVQAGRARAQLKGRRDVETAVSRSAFDLGTRLRPVKFLSNRGEFQYRTRAIGSSVEGGRRMPVATLVAA